MKIAPATPELPVVDVTAAQEYYRDRLGFAIGWSDPSGIIGAVCHGECALFFRRTEAPICPSANWIFAEDIDQCHAEMQARQADIVDPLGDKPWGLRQFTVRDLHGHLFHFHHDP